MPFFFLSGNSWFLNIGLLHRRHLLLSEASKKLWNRSLFSVCSFHFLIQVNTHRNLASSFSAGLSGKEDISKRKALPIDTAGASCSLHADQQKEHWLQKSSLNSICTYVKWLFHLAKGCHILARSYQLPPHLSRDSFYPRLKICHTKHNHSPQSFKVSFLYDLKICMILSCLSVPKCTTAMEYILVARFTS